MSLKTRLAGVLALALVVFAPVAITGPAAAEDPIPTTTHLTMTGYGVPGTIKLFVTVTSSSGVPTGTVTFTGTMPTTTVPLGADGKATASVPTNGIDAVQFLATFNGTGAYAGSVSDPVHWEQPLGTTRWQPEPTVARLGGAFGLQLTLTFATRVTNRDGVPKVGLPIHFSLLAPMPPFLSEPTGPPAIEICSAITDANGFATCKGKALLGALLSILTGGAYATEYAGFFPTSANTKLPALIIG